MYLSIIAIPKNYASLKEDGKHTEMKIHPKVQHETQHFPFRWMEAMQAATPKVELPKMSRTAFEFPRSYGFI